MIQTRWQIRRGKRGKRGDILIWQRGWELQTDTWGYRKGGGAILTWQRREGAGVAAGQSTPRSYPPKQQQNKINFIALLPAPGIYMPHLKKTRSEMLSHSQVILQIKSVIVKIHQYNMLNPPTTKIRGFCLWSSVYHLEAWVKKTFPLV
jgi:hypothetical protein